MIETFLRICLSRLAKVISWGTFHSELTVRVMQAPVHTLIVWSLLRLYVGCIHVPQNLVLKRYLLILKRLFQLFHVSLIFWVYLSLLDPLRTLFIFFCFGFHGSFLLIEVELHLIETLKLGRENEA